MKKPFIRTISLLIFWGIGTLSAAGPIQLYFRDYWKPEMFRPSGNGLKFELVNIPSFRDPQALEISFAATEKNIKQVVFLDFPDFPADLDKFETLEFDTGYPVEPTRYKLTLCGENETGAFMHVPKLKQAASGQVIQLSRPNGVKLAPSQLKMLYLMHYTPAAGMRLQVANLRWVDRTPERLDGLAVLLEQIQSEQAVAVRRWADRYSHRLSLAEIKKIRSGMGKIILAARSGLKKKLAGAQSEEQFRLLKIDRQLFTLLNPEADFAESIEEEQQRLHAAIPCYGELDRRKMLVGISDAINCQTDFPAACGEFARQSVDLTAARGEYESCQLAVIAGKKPLENVRLEITRIDGPGAFPAQNIETAPLGWRLGADGHYYAEMLRPDIRSFPVGEFRLQPIWVNIKVPPETVPGKYRFGIQVSADGVEPQTAWINLQVHPFTLPRHTSFPHIVGFVRSGHPGKREREAELVAAHRVNCSGMYESQEVPLAERQRNYANGNSLFNLMRIKAPGTEAAFERLERVYQETKADPEILKRSYIYGFDEVQPAGLPKMLQAFEKAAKLCPGVPIICAVNRPLWNYREKLEYPDILALTLNLIRPDTLKLLKDQGKKVWWYNLYCLDRSPYSARNQFLATEKTGLEGALFYNLGAGSATNYGAGLYPDELRPADGAFQHYGLLRRNHRGVLMSTLAFEMWREGLEDYEYWLLLKKRVDQLAPDHPLFQEAQQLLQIPENVAPSLMKQVKFNTKDSCLYDELGTGNYADILSYRQKLAEMICRLEPAGN